MKLKDTGVLPETRITTNLSSDYEKGYADGEQDVLEKIGEIDILDWFQSFKRVNKEGL